MRRRRWRRRSCRGSGGGFCEFVLSRNCRFCKEIWKKKKRNREFFEFHDATSRGRLSETDNRKKQMKRQRYATSYSLVSFAY